jgi:hypothetical protein
MGLFLSFLWYKVPKPEVPPPKRNLLCFAGEQFPIEASRAPEDVED